MKPFGIPRRRRTPRRSIQPDTMAIDVSPKRLIQVVAAALGGAITIPRPPPIFRLCGGIRFIGGSRTPLAR